MLWDLLCLPQLSGGISSFSSNFVQPRWSSYYFSNSARTLLPYGLNTCCFSLFEMLPSQWGFPKTYYLPLQPPQPLISQPPPHLHSFLTFQHFNTNTHTHTHVYINYCPSSPYEIINWRKGFWLFCSLPYSWCFKWCLVFIKYLINNCWMNEWTKWQPGEDI